MTGHSAKADGVLELGEGGEISVDFFLMPEPIELADCLLAIGERTDPISELPVQSTGTGSSCGITLIWTT